MFKAVVLDLDGTLLNSEKKVSIRNLNSVLACHRDGMEVIIATARPPRAVELMLPEQLMEISSFVYYNGAIVSNDRLGMYLHNPIKSSLSTQVIEYCLTENSDIEVSLEVEDEWLSLRELDLSIVIQVKDRPVVKTLEELKEVAATKILISGQIDIEKLREQFNNELNILVTDNGNLIQIMAKDVSKEDSVLSLLERMGIGCEEAIVFGDDYNDVGLFQMCGWPVAMENAIEELKNIAKIVTLSNDEDGVAVELERVFKQYVHISS